MASAWSRGRGVFHRRQDLRLSVRLRVLKAVVKGVLFIFCRTRAWQSSQVYQTQAVIHVAVRRAFNVRTSVLRHHGLSNGILCRLAQWEAFLTSARRASLLWLGHIARVPVTAPQKQILFGWLDHASAKPHSPFKQAHSGSTAVCAWRISKRFTGFVGSEPYGVEAAGSFGFSGGIGESRPRTKNWIDGN